MTPESFSHGNHTCGESLRRVRFVPGHISANLSQPRTCQRRPDDLYWHSFSSSCSLPHTHLGSGSSLSVPQESNHAFIFSCLM